MTRHDSGYSPFLGRDSDPPSPDLVEILWRVVGPSGKPIVCGIFRDTVGLQVFCHYAESIEALIRSERVSHMDIARDVAAAWKRAAVDKGFEEML
jgi:hypothetical protein